jgi:hypothetical protein
MEAMKLLSQNATYVGSPLLCSMSQRRSNKKDTLSQIILAPGARAKISLLEEYGEILKSFTIYAKWTKNHPNLSGSKLQLVYKDYLDFPTKKNNQDLAAIIITSDGKYRGSGWFNEAISYGVPVIITSAENQRIFSETFTKYKYIDLRQIGTFEDLKSKVLSQEYSSRPQDILEHNEKIKIRLKSVFQSELN